MKYMAIFNSSSNKFTIHGKTEEKTNSPRLYAGSSFDAKSYAAVNVGDNSFYKSFNAEAHDKYD